MQPSDLSSFIIFRDSWPLRSRVRALQELFMHNPINRHDFHGIQDLTYAVLPNHCLSALRKSEGHRTYTESNTSIKVGIAPLQGSADRTHTLLIHNTVGQSLATLLDQPKEYVKAMIDVTIRAR